MTESGTTTPIFVICRDRLAPLLELVGWLEDNGYENLVLVDNDSTFGPLLDYYESTPHRVELLGANLGPRHAIWGTDLVARYAPDSHFVVTDCDVVPDERCPGDLVDYLRWAVERYPSHFKAGPALRIDDLPDHYAAAAVVRRWERQFWHRRIATGLYRANIDTTFALYRPNSEFRLWPSIRTGTPYVARHLPWYADSANPTAEERYYVEHASPVASWSADEAAGYVRTTVPKLSLMQRARWALHARTKLERNRAVAAHYVPRVRGDRK